MGKNLLHILAAATQTVESMLLDSGCILEQNTITELIKAIVHIKTLRYQETN